MKIKQCIFFQQDRCAKGSSCTFGHDTDLPDIRNISFNTETIGKQSGRLADGLRLRTARASTSTQPPQDSRSLVPCRFHLAGGCKHGKNCPFSHSIPNTKVTCPEQASEPNDDKEPTDFSGYFSGAFVQFEDGARLSKIALPSDTSTVRINGLPADSTRSSVSAMLLSIDFHTPPASIRISNLKGADTSSADVTFEDVSCSKQLCANLASAQTRDRKYLDLEALRVPCIAYPGPSSRRVNCRKVHISWHKPTRSAKLNFGSGDSISARRAYERFNAGSYKVCGQKVVAVAPKLSSSRGGTFRSLSSTVVAVLLKDLPYQVTRDDIQGAIYTTSDKPRHIELEEDKDLLDLDITRTFVESSLVSLGAVEFYMSDQIQGKRFKAVARFLEEESAREAVNSLNNKPQNYLDGKRLTVKLVSSAKFKVRTTIDDVLEDQISEKGRGWSKSFVQLRVYRNTDQRLQFTTLVVEGEQAKEVASSSAELEKILAGKRIEDGDTTAFNESLTAKDLKQIQWKHDVVLVRNKLRKEIRFFGPIEQYSPVRDALIELSKAESMTVHTISLEPDQFSWACTGGFKQIANVLGDNVASFDIVSRPQKILINGSKTQYQVALGLIQAMEGNIKSSSSTKIDQTCTVCWTEAEDPVVTGCNHVYCLDCFESLCLSKSPEDKEPSLCCLGELGQCGKIFSLEELHDHASSATFEKMLETSFSSYIRSNPQSFRYCPTADCGYVYRTTSTPSNHTCMGCLQVICTGCHETHLFMTCAEFKDVRSGGYEALSKYKEEKGIKDCPKCTTPLEKTEGCNHMTCSGCGAHICWVCLETFTETGPVYSHMNAAHGGMGLDHLLRVANNEW